jgi:hypothetical protein
MCTLQLRQSSPEGLYTSNAGGRGGAKWGTSLSDGIYGGQPAPLNARMSLCFTMSIPFP